MVIKIIAMSVYHRVNGACSSHLRWIRNPNQYTMHVRWLDIRKWYSIQRYSSKCYPSETCHINQGLWIYQKMIEYDKIWCCLMSRTDPILMAKNGGLPPVFHRTLSHVAATSITWKKMHYFPFDPHAEFPHGDIPRSPPCASPLHGGRSWTMAVFVSRDSKNDSIGDLKIQRFLRWNGRIWHHTEGLAGLAGWRSGILMNIAWK